MIVVRELQNFISSDHFVKYQQVYHNSQANADKLLNAN